MSQFWKGFCVLIIPIIYGLYLITVSPLPVNTAMKTTQLNTPPISNTHTIYLPYLSTHYQPIYDIAFVLRENQPNANSLWLTDSAGLHERKLLDEVDQIAWSNDGKQLAMIHKEGLWLLTLANNKLTPLVQPDTVNGAVASFAWSPDNQMIAFRQVKTSSSTTFGLINVKTTQLLYHETEDTHLLEIAWSPNSQKIALNWFGKIGVLDIANLNMNYFFTTQADLNAMQWSPDSQWLAFAWRIFSLKIARVTTSSVSLVEIKPDFGGAIENIIWSPQNDRVAVFHYSNGRYSHYSVYITDITGYSIDLERDGDISKPVWADDGEGIYISAVNFAPDDPNLVLDPRLLYFDKTGQFIARLDNLFVTPMLLPHGQWLYIDKTNILHLKSFSQTMALTYTINITSNIWGYQLMPQQEQLLLAIGNFNYPSDVGYGSLYSFDFSTGKLTRLSQDYYLKYYAISPVAQPALIKSTP